MGFIEDQIAEELKRIPREKHGEVLKLVREFRHQHGDNTPRKSLEGLWADQGLDLSKEDIDELRREVWAMSPRNE